MADYPWCVIDKYTGGVEERFSTFREAEEAYNKYYRFLSDAVYAIRVVPDPVAPNFPLPGMVFGEQTVIASINYDDNYLAAVLLLNPTPPFFTAAIVDWSEAHKLKFIERYDHFNIVPAINGESEYNKKGEVDTYKCGYIDLGGDY